ncbi:MAG: hypothetical protein IJW17_08365 [Lentisphaeria bacterium]|nr:hypothetical protein [Lentisphaeria bacterium]
MPEEKSDAEIRLLMLQIAEVEKNAPAVYPAYKRGVIIGLTVLFLCLAVGFLLTLGGLGHWLNVILKTAVILGIVAFFWGAFRPQK